MTGRLLDRQVKLLEYLTSGSAIFSDKQKSPLDPSLEGIDRRMLDMEARFSHEKRMEKIAAVFPATLGLLGAAKDAILREFVEACPPQDISRIENARQFQGYLVERWRREPPVAPYLPDVLAFELACAELRIHDDTEERRETDLADAPRPAIRRKPGVILLRTTFDIRTVFERDGRAVPPERETLLAIALKSGDLQILEIGAEVFDLLSALDRWTSTDGLSGADDLMTDLAQADLLELRR